MHDYIRQSTILCHSCFQDHKARVSFLLYSTIHFLCGAITGCVLSPQRTPSFQHSSKKTRGFPYTSGSFSRSHHTTTRTIMASEEKVRLLPKTATTTTSVIWNFYRFAAADEKKTTPLCNVCLKAVQVHTSLSLSLMNTYTQRRSSLSLCPSHTRVRVHTQCSSRVFFLFSIKRLMGCLKPV